MKRLRVIFFTSIFMSSSLVFALEIDEKLTIRFLKVSSSKKTILINRGAEDGLVVGDHAKFYITSGVIARGIVEKVSPSRSIWSLYRLVEPNEVIEGKVLNLKIASPVKITSDATKSIKEEPIPSTENETSKEKNKNNNSSSKESSKSIDAQDMKELEEMGAKKEDDSSASTENTNAPAGESSKKSKVLKK